MTEKTTIILTLTVLGIAAAILIGYDFVVAYDKTPGNTISEIVLDFSLKHPIVPFVLGAIMGILAGHLFWPQR